MPFFMFISGRFSLVANRTKYKYSIVSIFETYIVFQLIRLFKPLFGGTGTIIDWHILYPKGTLWYLAYLLVYRLIIYYIPAKVLKMYSLLILSFSFLLGIAWGFMPTSFFQKMFSFLPYFFLGYYSTFVDIKKQVSKIPFCIAILLVTGIWLSIFFFFNFDIANILYYDTPYYKYTPEISPLVLCLSRCSEYLAAIAISIILMRINLNKCILSQYGSSTLFIYMYHTFIILGLRSLIYENYLWQNEIILIIYAICIVIFLLLLSKIKIFCIIMNPITYFYRKNDMK